MPPAGEIPQPPCNGHMEFMPDAATRYLKLLDDRAILFCFSWYPEKGTNTPLPHKLAGISSIVFGRFDHGFSILLAHLNYFQRAIYVTINKLGRTEGGMDRSDANVAEVRAIFADLDDDLPETPFPIPPTALVRTSVDQNTGRARHQAFWRCNGLSLDEFDVVQRRLVADWKADPASVNRSRIQRLPGYWHQKNGIPHLVEIVEANDKTYSREEILAAFPPIPPEMSVRRPVDGLSTSQRAAKSIQSSPQQHNKHDVPYSGELARDLLRFIPAKAYDHYWPVIAAMKRWAGRDNVEAREIAREWARSEPSVYDEREFDKRWNRNDPHREKKFTVGTIFHLARKNGWKGKPPPRSLDGPGWMNNWLRGGSQ